MTNDVSGGGAGQLDGLGAPTVAHDRQRQGSGIRTTRPWFIMDRTCGADTVIL